MEKWKSEIGAQKCPSCLKLIEKDDPNTCNHMVHKITDGSPCVHERTDFCYLCGEAVTQDYPHDEVNHPGINHFPEGVFQKCRVILAKEREEEREQLRHMRRNRIRNAQRARRGRRDQQAEGDGGEDARQVATDVVWTGDVLPGAPQENDPTTGIQPVITSIHNSNPRINTSFRYVLSTHHRYPPSHTLTHTLIPSHTLLSPHCRFPLLWPIVEVSLLPMHQKWPLPMVSNNQHKVIELTSELLSITTLT